VPDRYTYKRDLGEINGDLLEADFGSIDWE